MTKFNELKEKYLERLEMYVPVVERVHGGEHPEFFEVRKLFDQIKVKLEDAGSQLAELETEFAGLQKITNNYSIPQGVCETYEAVYEMLAELNQAYKEL